MRIPNWTRMTLLGVAATQAGCLEVDMGWDASHRIVGSGILVTETRPIGDVRSIVVSGEARAIIYQSDHPWLEVTAEANLLPYLWIVAEGHTLVVGQQPGLNLVPTRELRIRVGVRDLDAVSVSGAAHAEIPSLRTEGLSVAISGAAVVSAAGIVDWQDVSVSGDGYYDGAALESWEAVVTVSGAGVAVVRVVDRLEVWGSGVGVVEYYGRPFVQAHLSGSAVARPVR